MAYCPAAASAFAAAASAFADAGSTTVTFAASAFAFASALPFVLDAAVLCAAEAAVPPVCVWLEPAVELPWEVDDAEEAAEEAGEALPAAAAVDAALLLSVVRFALVAMSSSLDSHLEAYSESA